MTDKEFKRLSRPQLIEIIYQLQLQTESLTLENLKLKAELEDKQAWMQQAGDLTQTAHQINSAMEDMKSMARQLMDEVRDLCTEAERSNQHMLKELEAAVVRIQNVSEADAVQTKKNFRANIPAVDAILEKYRKA